MCVGLWFGAENFFGANGEATGPKGGPSKSSVCVALYAVGGATAFGSFVATGGGAVTEEVLKAWPRNLWDEN